MSEQEKEGVVFVELGHFNKHFIKNTRNRGPAGKHFEVFSPRYSQNYIFNEKFTPKMDTTRAFFSKIRAFFSIFKKGWGGLPSPPLVPRLWVWLNMHQYCWILLNTFEKYLKELFWLCQALNMHDHLTCSTGF